MRRSVDEIDLARHVLRQHLQPGHRHVADPGQQLVEAAAEARTSHIRAIMLASYPATLTVVNAIAESAGRSRPAGRDAGRDQARRRGRPPSRRCRCTAAAAVRVPECRALPPAARPAPAAGSWPRPRPPMTSVSHAVGQAGVDRLGGQHVADRLLEARRDVGHRHRLAVPLARLDPAGDRGLQPGEGEVEAVRGQILRRGQATRERDRRAVAVAGRTVDDRPARKAEPEQPRDLVERLAGRVVDGRAERRRPRRSGRRPAAARSVRRRPAWRPPARAAGRAPGCRPRRARPGG